MLIGALFNVHNVVKVEINRQEHRTPDDGDRFHTLKLIVTAQNGVEHMVCLFSDSPVGVTDHISEAVAA